MKKIFIFALFFTFQFCTAAETYLNAHFINAAEAEKKWGVEKFDIATFKNAPEKKKLAMAADAIRKYLFIGENMLDLRKKMGDPDSYFFSDTIYAYKLTDQAKSKESWHLLFIPDEKLEKIKEIKIHKKCCYP